MPTGWNAPISLLLVLLLLQSLLLFKWEDWAKSFRNPLVICSMLYFLFLAFSLMWSVNLEEGGRQLETKASFLLAPLAIFAGEKYWDSRIRVKSLTSFWLGTIFSIVIALLVATYRSVEAGGFSITHEAGTRYFFLYKHLSSPIMHPGYMATYVGIAMLIAIYFIRTSAKGSTLKKYWISIVLFAMMMILLQARINLLALLAVLGIGVLALAWLKRKYVLFSLPFIGIALLFAAISFAPTSVSDRYFQLPDFDYDISGDESDFNSATYRLAIWKCSGKVIADDILLGTGIGDNRDALIDSYEENQFWQGVDREFNAHNQYLETLIAGGIIAFLLLCVMLIVIARHGYRKRDYLLIAVLGFFSISLLTESMFERMWAVVLFTVLMPVLVISKK